MPENTINALMEGQADIQRAFDAALDDSQPNENEDDDVTYPALFVPTAHAWSDRR